MRCSLVILGIIGAALAAPPPCGSRNPRSDGYSYDGSPPIGYEASPGIPAKPEGASPADKPQEPKSPPIPIAREDDMFTAFIPETSGTNVTSLNGASSEAEGNTTVSVAADEDSGVASANADEEGTAIGAAGVGQALGLSTSGRLASYRPVHYTDGDYREYFQDSNGAWYYYPSPSPITSPAPKLGTPIQTMEGSSPAAGNDDGSGSVITGAQLGAALDGAFS